jgi:CRISPR-associated protein Cas2
MRAIIVYDVQVDRIDAVRHILKKYLTWIQNSVFEGEITPGKLEELRLLLSYVIDKEQDSIIVYTTNNPEWLERTVWGREKGTTDNVL